MINNRLRNTGSSMDPHPRGITTTNNRSSGRTSFFDNDEEEFHAALPKQVLRGPEPHHRSTSHTVPPAREEIRVMRSGARPQSNPRPQNHLRQRQEEEVHHRPERRPATPNRNRPVPRGRAESPARPSSGEVCRYFSNGHCKNGSSCKFSHGTS